MKIFVSHEHSDANELKKLKEQMAHYDVDLFLAHDDIQPGNQWNEVLKKELRDCNAILHIGNQSSKESSFCDQELGFALGLGKDIIPVLTDKRDSPWGFISDLHATKCDGVENLKFHILKDEFFNSIVEENRRKLKEVVGVDGFYLSDSYTGGYITLIPDNWNDRNYLTSFHMSIENTFVARVKIGYSGQIHRNHTMNMLLGYFTHLGKRMFSTINYNDNFRLGDQAKKLINSNLNCLAIIAFGACEKVTHEICNEALYSQFKGQEVVSDSLLRRDVW